MSVLDEILASTRRELEERKRVRSETELRESALGGGGGARRSLHAALNRPGIGVIAEFKRRSPSAGALREGAELVQIARAYERGGASALSVLTEGPHFGGSLEDLRSARAACGLPLLRKDFIVDPYQLYEALLAGADAVLLIVAALSGGELEVMRRLACDLGLDVLIEVHDSAELGVALEAGADLIGVNNRDLRDFSVDVERTFELLTAIPEHVTVVSESGIAEPEQLARLNDAGVAGVLVGESLMRAPVPEEALRALKGAVGGAIGDGPDRPRSFS
ncbi:MAG TPA: indole-3-glycerol phosphate synthase TrpC [Solirubrobacteraceae bacterium]